MGRKHALVGGSPGFGQETASASRIDPFTESRRQRTRVQADASRSDGARNMSKTHPTIELCRPIFPEGLVETCLRDACSDKDSPTFPEASLHRHAYLRRLPR